MAATDDDPLLVALLFNAAINRRDLDGLTAIMTEDHSFVDTANHRTRGIDAVRAAWSSFFTAFPDYRNVFTTLHRRGDTVLVLGSSECSEPALRGAAVWSALIRGDRVAEWRVYDDTPEVRRDLHLARARLGALALPDATDR
jgi:ketosteroid isomerase-like protein